MKRLTVYILSFLQFLFVTTIYAQESISLPYSIAYLRDSLDAIQYAIPPKPIINDWKVINIKTQNQYDNLVTILQTHLKNGEKNIDIRIIGKNIEFGGNRKEIFNWNYPKANIRIVGTKAKMQPYGFTFKRCDREAIIDNCFYSLSYMEFDINDIVVDENGNEVSIREETKQVSCDIENVKQFGQDVWRFRINLPDLTEEQCKDFYVLMTRDWTSARHKVVKVQDGWLYYHLDSDDLHSDRNPNVDWTQYRVRPRYTLINNPVSEGLHVVDGRIYIPKQYKQVRVNKGGQLITFSYCHFNSLEITGFKLNGCGNGTPFGIYSSTFDDGCFLHDNTFSNMSSMSISTAFSENVVIANNRVTNTREAALTGGGKNTTICGNILKKIGWMLNTRAITGSGENLHICDNSIENFNYSAIACGSTTPNTKATKLTYIIERNEIRLTKEYTDAYIQNTLADGGGIYIGPQCTWGIIRNNVVESIKGIHSNRGIFLDDGAKNLAIYGNYVSNTDNSYDIDLRLCKTYATDIPDHNTNNCVFQNILTGGYRFQERDGDGHCYGGQNVLLGTGKVQKKVVDLKDTANDETTVDTVPVDKLVKKYIIKS